MGRISWSKAEDACVSRPLEDSVDAQRKSGEKAVFLSVLAERKEKLLRAVRGKDKPCPRLRGPQMDCGHGLLLGYFGNERVIK